MNSREKPHFPSRESPPSALHPLSPSSSSPPLINFDATIGSVSSEQLGFEAFSALKSSQRGSFGEELVFTDIKEFPSSSPLMEFEASFSSLKSSIGSSSAEKSVGIYAMKELVSLSSPLETFSAQTFPKSHSVGEKLGLSGVIPSSSSSSLASIDFETFSTPKSSKGSFSREKLCFKERSSMSASLNMDFGGFSTVKLEHESVSCLEKMGSAIEEPPCLLTSSKWGSSEEKAIPVSSQVMLHEACSYKDAEGESMPAPQPLECLHGIPVPPFLSKTYDLVNDPSFDSVISWGSSGESFVVWDTVEFSRTILPRHFKHNNFSSFVRQLNTYGFRKIDTDQWEFANEEFLKDKRHLLKNIHRRKSHQGSQIGQSVGLPLALAKSGLEGEAQKLREEKNSLMQEVVKLQQEHLVTVNQMDKMNQRLQAVEQRQKQMVSFLAKLLQNPAFLSHLQCQKEHREVAATRAKRKFLKQQQAGPSNLDSSMEGQIVRYKPTWGIAATSTMELQDIRPDAGKRLPDYLLRDMVRKLGLDAVAGAQAQSGDVAMDESKKIFAETSKQIGVEGPRSPTSDPRDIVSKGKDALSSQVDVSSGGSEYFVAFPEDLSQEKMPSFLMLPTTESIIKEEDIWSMGFDAGASQPSSSHDVWGNILSSDVEELAVSAGLSNFWDLESHQPEAASGMDKWTADESSFDDLETQLGLLEEDLS